MRKVVRALCYLKELCLMAFFKLFGAVCRCCSAKYRELWLVCERGNDARDNGYWFYRYLKEKHPEINARYVTVLTGRKSRRWEEWFREGVFLIIWRIIARIFWLARMYSPVRRI